MKFKALGLLLAGLTLAVCAAPREDVDLTVWRIKGREVTATADQLNSLGTVTAGAAAGATALQPGVCAVTATTNAGVATVLVTNSLASQTVMCGWLSTNAGGFATAVNLTSIAVDGNSLLYTAADNPSPIFRTHTDGKTTLTITFSGASTNCFNVVQRDGAIKSSGSILPKP